MTHDVPPVGSEADPTDPYPAPSANDAPPPESAERISFPYARGYAVELSASGFRAPRWPERGEAFVAYRDVTHTALEPRALAIGTVHGVLLLLRSQLGGTAAAQELALAIRERVFALPSGDAHRARFARLDAKARIRWPWVAAVLVALTGVAYWLQRMLPGFYDAAVYRPGLLALGEWWRYAAAQFLHANLGHLLVNAAASLVAGAFVERSLGRMGTLFVAGFAGAGAMLASRFGAYQELLGFSGVAAGFFGALLALELFAPGEAPASARIPRSILVSVLAFQVVLDLMPSPPLPAWAAHSAGLAHLGGFVAGGAAALLVRDSLRNFVVAGALASVLGVAVSFGAVAHSIVRPSEALERQARELLAREAVHPGELNNLAWQIATSPKPTKDALAQAEKLALLAVQLTSSQEPTILDTLAEVYFVQGRPDEAADVIDRAIALVPGESYYAEQRRRFTGERAAQDRPEPPAQALPRAPQPADPGELPAPGEIPLPSGDEITV